MAVAIPRGFPASSPPDASDPILRAFLSAPIDDTPDTEQERAALEEAMADQRAGRWVSPEAIAAMLDEKRRAEGG